jgi:hypothetical protein
VRLGKNSIFRYKYATDDYGRPLRTGLYNGTPPATIPLTLEPTELYTSNFYDGSLPIEKGKLKRDSVRVFDAANTWLTTTFNFDAYGRVSGSTGNNYLMPADMSAETASFTYDFADHVLQETRNTKQSASVTHTITEKHEFDAWGRNTINKHKLNAGAEVTVSNLNYNWKSELIEKNLGYVTIAGINSYLQSIDFQYNAQGWLRTINSSVLGGSNVALQNCAVAPNPGAVSFNANPDNNDLFYLELNYDQVLPVLGGTLRKNGNIAQAIWRIRGRERLSYNLTYDYLNRLNAASFRGINDAGTALNNSNAYNENLTYDERGNILTLYRTGKYKAAGQSCWTDAVTDQLAYTYQTGYNRLQKISDSAPAASKPYGWHNHKSAPSTAQYAYDANGNLTADPYKGMAVAYNFLNLPRQMLWTDAGGAEKTVDIVYDATGRKLRKTVTDVGVLQYRQDYLGKLEYRFTTAGGLQPEAAYFSDGRVYNNGGAWRYEYYLKDHLGNIRLSFTDKNGNGVIDTLSKEILQVER